MSAPAQLSHVIYATLGAMAVMIIVSLFLGRTFWRNFLAFCAGLLFLIVLHAIGVREAAWAMVVIAGIVVIGFISAAMS